MSEEHNRVVSDATTEFRVHEPSVLRSAYSKDGEPTVVLSTDERPMDEGGAPLDLPGAVVTAMADRRGTSKDAIASYLHDRGSRLQVEAEEEQRRYEIEAERSLELPDDE